MHAEATVTWYAAHLAASFSRCYSYSFQPSPVVKHTDTAWLFPTFIAFQVVCASGSKATQIDLMYEWTHFLVFMDIAPDSLVNFSGAPHITIDGSIFSAHQLHSLHFPPWGWDKFLPAFLFSQVVFRSTFTFFSAFPSCRQMLFILGISIQSLCSSSKPKDRNSIGFHGVIDKGISVLLKAMLTPASIFQLFWGDAHMQRAKFFRKIARRQNIYLAGFQRGQSSFIQGFPFLFFLV